MRPSTFVGTVAEGVSRRSRLPASGVGAAVDGQPGAVDGTCLGARDEGDQCGYVVRLAIARDRHAFHHDRCVRTVGRIHIGVRSAWMHDVDGDLARAEVTCQALCPTDQRRLAGRVQTCAASTSHRVVVTVLTGPGHRPSPGWWVNRYDCVVV